MKLRIGTRGSKLALVQSGWVKEKIEKAYPDIQVELIRIKTTGDKILDSPLSNIGGKGLFVKEIEEALLRKGIHLAVHSMKDVPAQLPEGLRLAAIPERENPRDALISTEHRALNELPRGSRVGSGSLRRGAQLLHARPDLQLVSMRGNVDTRLRKLESEGLQAVILAVAGLKRLGLEHHISQEIPVEVMLPAIGQGALGLEVRIDDMETVGLLSFLNHEETEIAVTAERSFLKELQGGCQVPMAAFARVTGREIHLQGMVAEVDGRKFHRGELRGNTYQAKEIGVALARKLLDSGADGILKKFYGDI